MSGVSQPTHLAAVLHNAHALRDAGELTGARHLLEHALDVAKAAYGEDHPDVLTAARLLATVHREDGEPAAARRVLEEALAAGRVRLGEADPLMLALTFDLGVVAEELGNRHEARRNLGRVAAAGSAVLGHEDPAVRAARSYLAGEPTPLAGPPPTRRTRAITRPRTHVRATATGGALAAAVAAAVTAAAALGAVAVLTDRGRDGGNPATSPATDPPTRLGLSRQGGSITLTWIDPTGGAVPFVVTGAPSGQSRRVLATVDPGATAHTLNGLNPDLEYCFTILAVYAADRLVAGDEACTTRHPQPSASR
jgi:hypothetical protein